MKIETLAKYRCDGCGQEQTMPHDWVRIHPLIISGMAFASFGGDMGIDYCRECRNKMLASITQTSEQ